ncbi:MULTISPECIES: DUF4212 domain-containing protein [Halolamina]|uniref:Putative solute:sodium symporter small subunit n=1 Tax=Halolamina pelagica TaxID=699431 RepID=A0A1I5V836_9EURY|nr:MULTISPECIES: DUF4212 domain-containing protein [Halolamina]NHX37921.1 DUF4212 domain-containing protein [Halolamina sp. R1-12]SFQ03582.1 putative solute:sodium symporter small subunit [Halolamina pelagica]
MTHNTSHEPDDDTDDLATDGGRSSPPAGGTDGGRPSPPSDETHGGVAEREAEVDYLETEINILSPNTPFMRDHLKLVWAGFLAWTVLTWGPVVATYLAPELMTQEIPVIQFPAHYFTVAFVAPTSSLVLAFIYSRRRDRLDEKYGIDHSETVDAGSGGGSEPDESVAADGGEDV